MSGFTKYWACVVRANPKLSDAKSLTLNVAAYRMAIKRAFDAGAAHQSSVNDTPPAPASQSTMLERVVDIVFNGRKAR